MKSVLLAPPRRRRTTFVAGLAALAVVGGPVVAATPAAATAGAPASASDSPAAGATAEPDAAGEVESSGTGGASSTSTALDSTATTDDKSVAVPTGWWTYTGLTVQQIRDRLSTKGARLTDIEVHDVAAGTFSVVMVRNTGAYAVPGWTWYVGQTFTQVGQRLQADGARLLDVERYASGGSTLYAIVTVANSGSTARGWTWRTGATQAQVDQLVAGGQRLIHFESTGTGTSTRYTVIGVTNTGADAKAWQYFYGQTAGQVASRISSFSGRLVSLHRQADGTYLVVLVRNTAADPSYYFRYYTGLGSLSQAVSLAGQFGLRLTDVETYLVNGARRYTAVFIDNSNAATGRMRAVYGERLVASNGLPRGTWGAYLRPVSSSTPVLALQDGLRFEPASAIKVVHNLAAVQRVQAGTDSLGSSFVYYDYPSGTQPKPSNDCPNPTEEVAANRTTTTMDAGRGSMMSISDNRTTRGFTLRYGLTALRNVATGAGMTSTQINQPLIGCGYKDDRRNQTTLADFGRLYEGVERLSLLNGTNRTTFYAPMNGGSFNDNDLEARIRNVVQQEGVALGKTQARIDAFKNAMNWRHKGGSYGINCPHAFSSTCASGSRTHIRTIAGKVTLPLASRSRTYVFGSFVDQVTTGCSGCTSVTTVDAVSRDAVVETFRDAIRSHLVSY